jgi:hypothetical protein
MDIIPLILMIEVPFVIPVILAGMGLQWVFQAYLSARKTGRFVGTLFPPIARVLWASASSVPPHHDFQPIIAMLFAPVTLLVCFFIARAIARSGADAEV